MPDTCECGKLVEDHTLRELKAHHPAEQLNQEFQPVEGTELNLAAQGAMCGGVAVRGMVLQAENAKSVGLPPALPVIGFQFFGPDGVTEVSKVVLVLDPSGMRGLRTVIGAAIDRAILLARRAK